MYLVLFDKLMGAETMIIVMIIIRYKKCEDYIAKFSKLQTMAIVSIHQYRIKEDGTLDGGLMRDIKLINKRNTILSNANVKSHVNPTSFVSALDDSQSSYFNSDVDRTRSD